MLKIVGIYKITSPTNKIYIGQSWDVVHRKNHYSSSLAKGQKHLHNSLKKHGWDNHKFEIVHELPNDVTQEVLDNYEILCINQYKECGFEMMNIREGGSKGKHNSSTKQLISQNTKGIPRPTLLNRIITKKTRDRIGKANSKPKPEGFGKLISLSNIGRKLTEEQKQKLRKPHNVKIPTLQKGIPKLKLCKKIGKLDNNNQLIKMYNSVSEAALENNTSIGNISTVLKGKTKTTAGYKWLYL